MMICPENFYEENLKGKTAAQIMSTIRGLKNEIGRLKNIAEHPEYECMMHPSESVRISCTRDYLERAKKALVDAGGEYIPSAAEQKAMEFDANIPYISKAKFSIGGSLNGYETKIYTIDGDKVRMYVEHSLISTPTNIGDGENKPWDKYEFLEQLSHLHIGEWRKRYDTNRFGIVILDGTQWALEIYFSNGRNPVKISGDNAFPYNFDRLLELFEIEE